MRPVVFYALLMACSLFLTVSAQTVYHFQYRSADTGDSTLYNAFFLQNNTGSGFMRIRYDVPGNNDIILAELGIHSTDLELKPGSGLLDTSQTYYDTIGRPDFKFGSSLSKLPIPLFWFKLNPNSHAFEPSGVFFRNAGKEMLAGTLVMAETLNADALNRDFLSGFFSPGEDFLLGMQQSGSRGIFNDLASNVKMFTIIVANTLDPEIGKSTLLDRDQMMKYFDTLCTYAGIQKMPPLVIDGDNYNKANVIKAINGLKPGPNDIVVFYYSGHGFRKDNDNRVYPYIDLRPHGPMFAATYLVNSLNMQDIYTTIISQHARLNLVISDCCNTKVEDGKPIGKSALTGRGILDWSPANFVNLFLNPQPRNLLFTAADVNQKAACDSATGSFFSIYFREALNNNLSRTRKSTNWDQVISEARDETTRKVRHICCGDPCIWANGCLQNPVPVTDVNRFTGKFKKLN